MISAAQGYQIYANTQAPVKQEDRQVGTQTDSLTGGRGPVILTV